MFKAGDKVKVATTLKGPLYDGLRHYAGQTGEVGLLSEDHVRVKFDRGTCIWFNPEDLMHVVSGYHTVPLTKGVYGYLSKVREELEEAEDAEKQGNKIMLHLELSDLFGALREYAKRCGLTIDDLTKMSDATERAFKSGERK